MSKHEGAGPTRRLEHHGPTSHEVGMHENLPRTCNEGVDDVTYS